MYKTFISPGVFVSRWTFVSPSIFISLSTFVCPAFAPVPKPFSFANHRDSSSEVFFLWGEHLASCPAPKPFTFANHRESPSEIFFLPREPNSFSLNVVER